MSLDVTERSITEAVQRTFDGCRDERTREVVVKLVQHLHDFAREVRLTGDEWFTAMDFLVRVGQISSDTRQEYVLLSDILGLSMLVHDAVPGRRPVPGQRRGVRRETIPARGLRATRARYRPGRNTGRRTVPDRPMDLHLHPEQPRPVSGPRYLECRRTRRRHRRC